MKKVFCLLLVLIGVALFVSAKNTADLYAKSAVVVDLDRQADIVTIKDSQGFLWSFNGCEDWEIGDNCACVMSNCGTDSIFDDKIISATFQG